MPIFNYLVYRHFRRKALTGSPIHSIYKQYEDDRSDVWFIHK